VLAGSSSIGRSGTDQDDLEISENRQVKTLLARKKRGIFPHLHGRSAEARCVGNGRESTKISARGDAEKNA
jgi:hypothetical protein